VTEDVEEEQARIEEATAIVKKVLQDKRTEESSSEPHSEAVIAEMHLNQTNISAAELEAAKSLAKELNNCSHCQEESC